MSKNVFVDINNLSDEEFDNICPDCTTNNLRSALPLCVYLILKDHSSSRKHLTQGEIIDYIDDRFGFVVERKALSRCLHTLSMLDVGIYSCRKYGSWYDENDFCHNDFLAA